ncbi:hypothetical protein GGX14DRAFT_399809 [Mycena pura]|uniref:Uncharacterized protein n=1 Tax=Mycena pura TaxID=153505 RepID=A0AAD6V7R6_9AGAR|nr:hypothetical protein GGX14DRAFT_399809 [Mycena pura]
MANSEPCRITAMRNTAVTNGHRVAGSTAGSATRTRLDTAYGCCSRVPVNQSWDWRTDHTPGVLATLLRTRPSLEVLLTVNVSDYVTGGPEHPTVHDKALNEHSSSAGLGLELPSVLVFATATGRPSPWNTVLNFYLETPVRLGIGTVPYRHLAAQVYDTEFDVIATKSGLPGATTSSSTLDSQEPRIKEVANLCPSRQIYEYKSSDRPVTGHKPGELIEIVQYHRIRQPRAAEDCRVFTDGSNRPIREAINME